VRQSRSRSLLRHWGFGELAIMVNGPLPVACLVWRARRARARGTPPRCFASAGRRASIAWTIPLFRRFAQILGKLDFFKLGENLQRILFDYVEKRASTANAPFNRAC
jgi:hypothetical protein